MWSRHKTKWLFHEWNGNSNNSHHLSSAYYLPGTKLNTLYTSANIWGSYSCYHHFTSERLGLRKRSQFLLPISAWFKHLLWEAFLLMALPPPGFLDHSLPEAALHPAYSPSVVPTTHRIIIICLYICIPSNTELLEGNNTVLRFCIHSMCYAAW